MAVILNKSDIKSGKKMSSDPAYNLAAQYLAAALNYHVGALRCLASDRAVNSSQALLETINFLGTGTYANKMTATQASTRTSCRVSWTATTTICRMVRANEHQQHSLSPAITSNNTVTFNSGVFGTFNVIATGSPTLTLSESGTLPAASPLIRDRRSQRHDLGDRHIPDYVQGD